MRRILDGGRNRWSAELIALACICTSVSDPDFQHLQNYRLGPTLAIVALGLIVTAIVWVLLAYLFAWSTTLAGRHLLDGSGEVADVRAAIAWGSVPLIWSVLIRIPVALHKSKLVSAGTSHVDQIMNFVSMGGCSIAVTLFAIQLALYVWVMWVTSNCVGEAMRFSSWRGLGALAITSAIPVVVGVAAYLTLHT